MLTKDDLLKLLQESFYEAYRPDYPSDMTDDEVKAIINDNKLLGIIADAVSQYVDPYKTEIEDLKKEIEELKGLIGGAPTV